MSTAPERPSRWMGAFFSLVGVLMFLGFGAALGSRVLDSIAAPDEPTHLPAAPLGWTVPGETSWVAIDGAFEPCTFPTIPSGASSASYRLLAGRGGAILGLAELSDGRACSDAPHEMRGTLRARLLDELQLPPDASAFLAQNVGREIPVLWVDDSPHLGFGEASMWGAMAALGLCIAWFYAAAFLARAAKVRLQPRTERPALPLLPSRPLEVAARYRASPLLGIVFLAVCALMFAGITVGQWPASGAPDGGTIALMAFGGVMTLVFVVFLLAILRNAFRARPRVQAPREAWAEVLRHEAALAKGVDVGNRALAYRDPFTRDGEPERVVELVIGANEGMPWIVDGHVLVARAEGDTTQHVMRQDGGPFELTDAEVAKLGG